MPDMNAAAATDVRRRTQQNPEGVLIVGQRAPSSWAGTQAGREPGTFSGSVQDMLCSPAMASRTTNRPIQVSMSLSGSILARWISEERLCYGQDSGRTEKTKTVD